LSKFLALALPVLASLGSKALKSGLAHLELLAAVGLGVAAVLVPHLEARVILVVLAEVASAYAGKKDLP
jgi:hypothetical protein